MTDTTAGEGVSPVYTAALETLRKGAPGLSDITRQALARSINMKVSLAAQPSAGAQEEAVGCAEPQVGRAVYERIEKLMDLNPQPNTPEWVELDYLSYLTGSVEEYGSYDGPLATPSQPDTGAVEALREALERVTDRVDRAWKLARIGWLPEVADDEARRTLDRRDTNYCDVDVPETEVSGIYYKDIRRILAALSTANTQGGES